MSEDLKGYALPVDEQIAIFKAIMEVYVSCISFSGLCRYLSYKLQEEYNIHCQYDLLFLYFPLFTYENAQKHGGRDDKNARKNYWWEVSSVGVKQRIKFLEWMIEELNDKRATQECDPSNGNRGVDVGEVSGSPAASAISYNEPTEGYCFHLKTHNRLK
jgi:hypothetical protein